GPGAESVFCPCGEQISERKVHLALTFGNRGCHPLFQQSVTKSFILAGQIRQTRQMFDDSRLKLLLQQRESLFSNPCAHAPGVAICCIFAPALFLAATVGPQSRPTYSQKRAT